MSDHSELIARVEQSMHCPPHFVLALVPELASALKEAHRRIDLMRDLHRPIASSPGGVLRCKECRNDWPCDTSWRLDGFGQVAA